MQQSGTGSFPWLVRSGTLIEDGFVEVKFKVLLAGEGLDHSVDLSGLGIDMLVTGTQSSNADGQFLLAPGARIEIGALFYENSTDGWYFVDSTTGLFSPSITGNLTADNFIV